ncbi:hypothetical protein M3084_10040 [Succinatimonas hippei]|uniref:hypothetical protein n=1 Tax=Succinatimonas hippei TaxID=626938 RepID=UPI0020122703|nr:hypothetical protein [Succinatimonas hippei]MCL1604187.1 hypothetical protein [Succinatimonas hippei]
MDITDSIAKPICQLQRSIELSVSSSSQSSFNFISFKHAVDNYRFGKNVRL